ncbi:MAG: serine/threonine-protein phosphatase, partial [Treponema sp.]|nr:serine/threonine-protein phosphatase [Treponema sp.]
MPKDIKANIISKNLHRLAILEQVLFSFGILMIIVSFIRFSSDWKAHYNNFIYYAAYILNSLIVLLAAIRTTHHPEWPVWRRNQPTYLAIFFLLILSVYLLFTSSTPLSFYTVYVNVCIIAIVMLAVEPAFFIGLLTAFTVAICMRLHSVGSVTMILNMCLTTIIMSILSLYKWASLINEFTFEKIQNNHIQSMEREIELAAFVQESFSKRKMPELKDFDIAYYSKAMAGVSGDMYDFYTDDDVLEGAGIFDVSGHGIASGLVTMLVRNIFQQEFHQNETSPLYEVMEIIDKRIRIEKRNIENYLTGILLRMKGNTIEIVNAGHPCPIIYKKKTGECSYFDEKREFSSTVIGLSPIEPFFQETSFEMESGDEIILFTDGIKEAMNALHNEYGSSRFLISVKNAVQRDFKGQIPSVLADIGHFTENAAQSDDITIV